MDIQVTKAEKAFILTVRGKLDAITSTEYEQKVTPLLATSPCFLILDFEHLDYISSAGLRSILVTAKRIQSKGGQLHFAKTSGAVLKVFEISGFSSMFQMWNSVTDALVAIR